MPVSNLTTILYYTGYDNVIFELVVGILIYSICAVPAVNVITDDVVEFATKSTRLFVWYMYVDICGRVMVE